MKYRFLLGVLALVVLPLCALDVVSQRRPRCCIVLDSNSEVKAFAASEFQAYIEKITQGKLAVSTEMTPGVPYIRYVILAEDSIDSLPEELRKKSAEIRSDGYLLDVSDSGIWIVSQRPRGILYGTYYLLKKYGGCRWFLALEGEEYYDQKPDFVIPNQRVVRNPVFDKRTAMINGVTPPEAFLWLIRNGYNFTHLPMKPTANRNVAASYDIKRKLGPVYGAMGTGLTTMLTLDNMAVRTKMFAEHPEYFGVRDGQRVLAGLDILRKKQPVSQPCTTNDEAVKIMVRNSMEIFNFQKGNIYDLLIGNDDHTYWCQCPKCTALDNPAAGKNGRRSDRWWDFVNRYSKELFSQTSGTDVSLEVFAYQDFRDPPRLITPDPRVSVMLCPHGRCYAHNLDDPACEKNHQIYWKMFTDWRKYPNALTTYEYHTVNPGPSAYVPICERTWIHDLHLFQDLKMRGYLLCIFFPTQALGNDPRRHYMYRNIQASNWQLYCFSGHFSWDIDDDYEAVQEDYSSKYYGAAWKYIKPYRALLEKALTDAGVHIQYGANAASTLGRSYDMPGVAAGARDLLDKAERAVAGDPVRLKRVCREKEFFVLNWEQSTYSVGGRDSGTAIGIARTDKDIVLDGMLDDPAWKDARPITNFTPLGKVNALASPQTSVRMLCKEDDLYFAVEAQKSPRGCQDIATEKGIYHCNGSYIQIFLTPSVLNGKYLVLYFTHNGFHGEALFSDSSTANELFGCGYEVKQQDLPDRWLLEIRLPGAKLGGFKDGQLFLLNIGRAALTDDGKKQYSSNCQILDGGFHSLQSHKLFRIGTGKKFMNNLDFEELMTPGKAQTSPSSEWEFVTGNIPKWWSFSKSKANGGRLEVRQDGAYRGKNYIRVTKGEKGGYPTFGQIIPQPQVKRYRVTCWIRGKATFQILGDYTAPKGNFTVNSPMEWKQFQAEFEPGKRKALNFRILQGSMDLDALQIEEMLETTDDTPDALRHL